MRIVLVYELRVPLTTRVKFIDYKHKMRMIPGFIGIANYLLCVKYWGDVFNFSVGQFTVFIFIFLCSPCFSAARTLSFLISTPRGQTVPSAIQNNQKNKWLLPKEKIKYKKFPYFFWHYSPGKKLLLERFSSAWTDDQLTWFSAYKNHKHFGLKGTMEII